MTTQRYVYLDDRELADAQDLVESPTVTSSENDLQDPSFLRLSSERVLIRRFEPADAIHLAAYRNDCEVARYQSWKYPCSVRDAEDFIASLRERAPGTPGAWFQFAVSLPAGALIGDVGLGIAADNTDQAELGFSFAQQYQGRGYAIESVGLVARYAFERLSIRRLFALTDSRNARAQRLLERLRFRREGAAREATWFRGEWVTDFLYAKLATD